MTRIAPIRRFYPAEDYHRDYFNKHRDQVYCRLVISPKINKLRKQWTKLLKE